MSDIQLACHTAPWGTGSFIQALTDISAAGFAGVETNPDLVVAYEDRVSVIEEIFTEADMALSGISAHVQKLTPENIEEEVERAINTARFLRLLKSVGSDLLLLRLPVFPDAAPTPEDIKLCAEWLNQVGKLTQDLNITTVRLPEINQFPRTATEINKFIGLTVAKYVKLSFDAWMMHVRVSLPSFFTKYGSRIRYVVMRDIKTPPKKGRKTAAGPLVTVALGKGGLNLTRMARTLFTKGYEGWVSMRLPPGATDHCAAAHATINYAENNLDMFV